MFVSWPPHWARDRSCIRNSAQTHTSITPSMSLAALRWTYPPQSLTLPSSAISFVFGQMRCSRPGGSNTVWGAITQKQSVTNHSAFIFLYSSCLTSPEHSFLWIHKHIFLYVKGIYHLHHELITVSTTVMSILAVNRDSHRSCMSKEKITSAISFYNSLWD